MGTVLATAVAAVGLFAGTNVDDMVVLAVLNASSRATGRPRRWQIWAGQYAGSAVLVVASLSTAAGLTLIPVGWLWLLLAPRNMPFGMVGSSPVVAQAQAKVSLDPIAYPSQSAVMTAIDQGQLYGAYVTGSSSDTLIVAPAKSLFARIYLEAAFVSAAHKLGRPVTVRTVKPLPSSARSAP